MSPKAAADVLVDKLERDGARRPMTVADAAVATGLPLRDAEAGLHWLTSEYRGHLRVTEDGDLVHVFPHGFTKPWETREAFARLAARVGQGLLGAAVARLEQVLAREVVDGVGLLDLQPVDAQLAGEAAVEEAEGIIAAWEAGAGAGVVTYNGKMIENLHVDIARRVLATHAAITSA